MRGDKRLAKEYGQIAEEFAARWIKEADDGDHFRLAFDKPGTWSQKYNLVWDHILGLNLFPDAVFEKEMAHYRKAQNQYGLPLDNRKTYTKLDWVLWTATLTQDQEDFAEIVRPVYKFLRETPDRSPMTDWYETENARKVSFTARPVVGGVFLKLLYDDTTWKKWSARDKTKADGYAPLPAFPQKVVVVPAADSQPVAWKYTFEEPVSAWFEPDFDDSTWSEGPSGFGTEETPGGRIGTVWNTSDIWLRRTFDFTEQVGGLLRLNVHHDEDADIYINGVLARRLQAYTNDYTSFKISSEAVRSLKPTNNVMAVHCHHTSGGQFIDVGITQIERK